MEEVDMSFGNRMGVERNYKKRTTLQLTISLWMTSIITDWLAGFTGVEGALYLGKYSRGEYFELFTNIAFGKSFLFFRP